MSDMSSILCNKHFFFCFFSLYKKKPQIDRLKILIKKKQKEGEFFLDTNENMSDLIGENHKV
jgi:hypothetical protein